MGGTSGEAGDVLIADPRIRAFVTELRLDVGDVGGLGLADWQTGRLEEEEERILWGAGDMAKGIAVVLVWIGQ